MPRSSDTFTCPNCDGRVPANALACPHCGADEETGWSQDTIYDDLDLPTGYGREEPPARTKEAFWKVVAVIVLVMIGLLALWGLW